MSWWQKKLLRYGLRYGLSRTGLLEDEAIDLDNLDITIGKQNVIELKNVGLNIKRISKLAQLPPSLRLETARILSLRLTIPADFYQSSIVAEVDGVEISARLEEAEPAPVNTQDTSRARSPVRAKTPQHRKMNRRLHSPPPYDPGGMDSSDDELRLPAIQDITKSFLEDEPLDERRELEALAYTDNDVAESVVSDSSDGDLGTGIGIGVPGFLANFLQGIVDRFKIDIQNVQVKVDTEIRSESSESMPVTLRLKIGSAELNELGQVDPNAGMAKQKRHVRLYEISLDLLSQNDTLATYSGLPSYASPATGRSPAQSSRSSVAPSKLAESQRRSSTTNTTKSSSSASIRSANMVMQPTIPPEPPSQPSSQPKSSPSPSPSPPPAMSSSVPTMDADHFTDARDHDDEARKMNELDLEIQPGDDNISWGSRRSKSSAPADDLWNSMISEDDLPESLLLEPQRAPTPRASSTRSNSPFTTRQRRNVSPYSRGITSPGSWPRPEESPERTRFQRGPGSWPTLDQSRHTNQLDTVLKSAYGDDESVLSRSEQSVDPVLTEKEQGETVDNKRAALEQISPERPVPQTPPEPEGAMDESMLTSQVYSHEEARSMYMSAMSSSPKMDIPGGWASPAHSAQSSSPGIPQLSNLDEVMLQDQQIGSDGTQEVRETQSVNATPRAQSPEMQNAPLASAEEQINMSVREVLYINVLAITLPTSSSASDDQPDEPSSTRPNLMAKSMSPAHGMPGTFSAYSDMSRSRLRSDAGSVHADINSVILNRSERSQETENELSLEVSLGVVCLQVDIATGRLLHGLSNHVAAGFQKEESKAPKTTTKSSPSGGSLSVAVHVDRIRMCFSEQLDQQLALQDLVDLPDSRAIDLLCDDLDFQMTSETSLQFGTFGLRLGGRDLLTFDKGSAGVGESQILPVDARVFAVSIAKNRVGVNQRPVTDISIQTAPVVISIDILAIDETFNSFGGLSGMLELGSSVLSENGASSPTASKAPKGVRFAQEPAPVRTDPEIKLNGRIGGITVSLRGPACAVMLRTSTLKAVYREAGMVATIERIMLTGPYIGQTITQTPLSVDLASLRIEYLLTPQDRDLERLLSLLTPSKDKYDDDDDIIIDTLLSQRRKGAILRLQVGDIKAKVEDWEGLAILAALSEDLTKLSAVTKYLPEDDKPGLLTTLRVKEGEARLPVNPRFGQMRLALQDLHLAHVGIPALLAFSIGNLFASQIGGPQVLRPMLPPAGLDGAPVVMARMLGNEIEPTIKLKLYNLCVEYSVPVILDLTGMDEVIEPEALVNELAQSVANLAMAESPRKLSHSPTSDASSKSQKKTNISLLVHDSAIGLTPQKLPSKVMVVLSDAHLSTSIPPSESMNAKLELRKASIFVTDRASGEIDDQPLPTHVSSNTMDTTQRLANALLKQGFVSVGSVMAAEVKFQARESDQLGGAKAIEVDVENELFLLETCADSTQTLIATLGGLAPPTPPSTVPKYLTQPMQIEDMMASFTGDPFVQPEEPPETLFDVDEGADDELESRLGISMLDDEETNELLAESEMSASLYGPVSGVFGMDDEPGEEGYTGDYPETAESLLEEDPFEMTISPPDMYLGDAALMRELKKQCKPALHEEPIDLGNYEIEDLGFDALGNGQQALGSQHRFNAPYPGKRNRLRTNSQDLPFRLRLRDFHVIWHIYDGYDWQRTRDGIVEAVEQVEIRAEERRARHRQALQDREDDESVIGDFLFNSIYIGVPADHDAQELRRQINRNIDEDVSETASIPVSGISRPTTQYSTSGQPRQRHRRRLKLGRSKSHKIAFELKGVSADVLLMPVGSGDVVSSVDLRLKDFEIFDKVPTSTWRKFLTHLDNNPAAREMSKPMFHIQLENVKTLESHSASEIVLRVSVLPLRLHVDQDALDFITRFFEFKDPEMVTSSEPSEQPFLQRVEVDTIDMCLDYKPKNVDYAGIRSGKTTEFMNFVTLEGCNIRLRHAIVYGLRGFDALHPTLNDIWMPDVKRNQLPKILAGLAPVRSLVNLGTGMRDVVAIPIREYKKDGRIVRSIQKGAYHFGKTTASELARLGAKVALGTQTMLANAEEFLSPEAADSRRPTAGRHGSSDQGWHDIASDDDEPEQRVVSAYANQPLGLLSGLKSARRFLEHDLLTAKDALIAVQGELLESRGPGGAAAAVVKHAPTVILRPVIGATRAVGTTLLGVGNQIDRDHLRRVDDKYKRR